MRVKINEELKGKNLFDYLKANKEAIIKQKCALPIKSEAHDFNSIISVSKKDSVNKSENKEQPISINSDELNVTIVGNTANWCDSHLDVLIPNCWDKTITESGVNGKNRIYHLKDHSHKTDGIIGKPSNIYSKDCSLRELGIEEEGSTQCLIMDSVVRKSFSEKAYQLYLNKMIKQHSIGLQYVKLVLCVNDNESNEDFANWQKYYPQVINKAKVDQYGYFWAVTEIKLLEISAVLWGSNEITPTIEENNIEAVEDTSKQEPSNDTQIEEQKEEAPKESKQSIFFHI